MNRAIELEIDHFVTEYIVYVGDLSEIKDLLLFFDLVRHPNYCELAGIVPDIHTIEGLSHC